MQIWQIFLPMCLSLDYDNPLYYSFKLSLTLFSINFWLFIASKLIFSKWNTYTIWTFFKSWVNERCIVARTQIKTGREQNLDLVRHLFLALWFQQNCFSPNLILYNAWVEIYKIYIKCLKQVFVKSSQGLSFFFFFLFIFYVFFRSDVIHLNQNWINYPKFRFCFCAWTFDHLSHWQALGVISVTSKSTWTEQNLNYGEFIQHYLKFC